MSTSEDEMGRLVSFLDKFGIGGVIFAALSCTVCFPALGVLATALGLGFLRQHESIAITTLLPLFSAFALVVNSYGWFEHRNTLRGFLSVLGPTVILATLYPLWDYKWSTYLFYTGITLMITVSVADLVRPSKKVCSIPMVKK